MKTHPFEPQISKNTRKLLVGTLPPENVSFYFSNSSNTRLWDILSAIHYEQDYVGRGGNGLNSTDKIAILNNLEVGISDIIYQYKRDEFNSTKDKHIVPISYKHLLKLAVENEISELLFVYQSAYKWFLHSLLNQEPVRLRRIKSRHLIGSQPEINWQGKTIKCTLLPSPLNRGTKGQTLAFKLQFYRRCIKEL